MYNDKNTFTCLLNQVGFNQPSNINVSIFFQEEDQTILLIPQF